MPTNYSLPSDRAYDEKLGVRKAGQRWFAFDEPMDAARRGEAKRFGMAIWNFHCVEGTRDRERWGITRDSETGDYWYRVASVPSEGTSMNRKSLWEGLHIAAAMPKPFQMKAILKDGKTHRCSPDHVFEITDVQVQDDGSNLWLKLDVQESGIGTEVEEQPLPLMHAVDGSASKPTAGRSILPDAHYLAIRDAAVRAYLEGGVRADEIKSLNRDYGINVETASAVFNNFRCLIEGTVFKAPMRAFGLQLFVDAIVAKRGDDAVLNVIQAIDGYVHYAETKLRQRAPGFSLILSELKREAAQATVLQEMVVAAEATLRANAHGPDASSESPGLPSAASEVLREVWVRGPQHAAFRRALQRRWADKCSVHGVACNDQLRASHIVAWSLDESRRGDVNNGLLLSVPLDNLFDRGLISFDDAGVVICSPNLSAETSKHFGVRSDLRIAWDHLSERDRDALRTTLAKHRARHGL